MNLYKIIGFVLTFVLAFGVVTNFTSYRGPEVANTIKEGIQQELENRQDDFDDNELTVQALEAYVKDIDQSLNVHSYQQLSLFRMVGCLVMLFGVIFLRMKKSIGLHLFLGGGLFTIITGFYAIGFGILGWIFNLWYIMILLAFGLYYFTKREELT